MSTEHTPPIVSLIDGDGPGPRDALVVEEVLLPMLLIPAVPVVLRDVREPISILQRFLLQAAVDVGVLEAAALCGYFDEAFNDFASAPFVDSPTHEDVNRYLRARFRRPWEEGRGLQVRSSTELWELFRNAAACGDPVLFEDSGTDLRLHAGTDLFLMTFADGTLSRATGKRAARREQRSGLTLDQWLTERVDPETPRGVFSGSVRLIEAVEQQAKRPR